MEYTITVTLLAKEQIVTKLGSKSCYKLSFKLKGNDLLKGKDSNLLWLTADDKKIPVFAKFKIPVGNGELRIESAQGI